MHRYYNSNPSGLETILTFSFGRRENVAYLLSGELKSRAEPDSLSLDVLTETEALEFLRDLLAQFRIRTDGCWAYPFSPEALEVIVKHIAGTKNLTPRRLMQYGNHVLQKSVYMHGPNHDTEIRAQEVHDCLADPELGALDVDQPSVTLN